jgi:hypothetical protein
MFENLSLIDGEDFGELQLRHLPRLAQLIERHSGPDYSRNVSQSSAADQPAWIPAISRVGIRLFLLLELNQVSFKNPVRDTPQRRELAR